MSTINNTNNHGVKKFNQKTILAEISNGNIKKILTEISQELIEEFNNYSTKNNENNVKESDKLGLILEDYIQTVAEEKKNLESLKANEKNLKEMLDLVNNFKINFYNIAK